MRKPDLGFSRKRPFSTDKSDCIRNGLSLSEEWVPAKVDTHAEPNIKTIAVSTSVDCTAGAYQSMRPTNDA